MGKEIIFIYFFYSNSSAEVSKSRSSIHVMQAVAAPVTHNRNMVSDSFFYSKTCLQENQVDILMSRLMLLISLKSGKHIIDLTELFERFGKHSE
jgi:hypothetical protein